MYPTASSVEVERAFSQGRLLITHVRNRLTGQTARALMCLGSWSLLGLIHSEDIDRVTRLAQVPEADGNKDGDVLMPEGYERIERESDK